MLPRNSTYHHTTVPREHPAGQVADIFNALLGEVNKQYPDDPIVSEISPAEKRTGGTSMMNAGSLIAAAQQLLGAVPSPNAGPLVGETAR